MKTKKMILTSLLIIFCSFGILFLLWRSYSYFRIRNAKIEVVLQEDLSLEFTQKKKISDYIVSINGTILNDDWIDSTTLGEKEVAFTFKNDEGIKIPYQFTVTVKDSVAPVVWLNSSYTVTKGSSSDFAKNILCGDNEDSHPTCQVIGEYDTNKVGNYPLVFEATDQSGNQTIKEFQLKVVNPSSSSSSKTSTTSFESVKKDYKKENTKIGIDVSGWQGDILFDKIKEAGVEFIIIKVGNTKGTNGDYHLDSKFIQNIQKANEANIPVGLYFFSYANSIEQAKNDANWVLEQIKDYKVDLPIAFDWENWDSFNEYHLSFYELSQIATTFLDTIASAGYEGMLYSSKNYLEQIWLPIDYPTWLAHYTKQTSYAKEYSFWQLCSNGRIPGIQGNIDINVMYEKD